MFLQDDWQAWQETISWLGNPTGPQASPVYMCGSGTVPGTVPSAVGHGDCGGSLPLHTQHHLHHHHHHLHSPQQQPQPPQPQPQTAQDPIGYGTEEFIDLDMLINYVADQHNGGANDPVPPDVMTAYTAGDKYYSK